jgi:hypothetical protein
MTPFEQMLAQRLGELQLELVRAQAIIQGLQQEKMAAQGATETKEQESGNGPNAG